MPNNKEKKCICQVCGGCKKNCGSTEINCICNDRSQPQAERVEDTRLRYQLHDIIVRGLVKNSELSAKGFKELLDFISSHLVQAYQKGQEDEAIKHQKEDLKTCKEEIAKARAEERERIKEELCDFRVNETEPWGTIKRLRKLLNYPKLK